MLKPEGSDYSLGHCLIGSVLSRSSEKRFNQGFFPFTSWLKVWFRAPKVYSQQCCVSCSLILRWFFKNKSSRLYISPKGIISSLLIREKYLTYINEFAVSGNMPCCRQNIITMAWMYMFEYSRAAKFGVNPLSSMKLSCKVPLKQSWNSYLN